MSTASIPPPFGAFAVASGTTVNPTTTSATFVALPEMTVTLVTNGRPIAVSFSGSFSVGSTVTIGDAVEVSIFVDGTELPKTRRQLSAALGLVATRVQCAHTAVIVAASKGSHTIDVRYRRPSGAGAATGFDTQRSMSVVELYAA